MFSSRRGLARLGPVVVMLVVAVSACGGSSTPKSLDLSATRQKITELANQGFGAKTTIGIVRCPQSVAQKQGNDFFCTVEVGGVPLRITVSQTDDQGAQSFQQGQAVLDRAALEATAASKAAGQGTPTTNVSCGTTPVLVETPGHEISCAVTFVGGATGVAKFKVTDLEGNAALVDIAPA